MNFKRAKKSRRKGGRLEERELERYGQRLLAGAGVLDAMTGIELFDEVAGKLAQGYGVVEAMKTGDIHLEPPEWELLSIGEQTGNLGQELIKVVHLRGRNRELRKEILGQLLYPFIVLVVSVSVMSILCLYVIPEMKTLYLGMMRNGDLPFFTEHIASIYGCLIVFSMAFVIIFGSAFWGLSISAKRNLSAAKFLERARNYLPGIGIHLIDKRQAKLCEQLSLLLKVGISLPDAIERISNGNWNSLEAERLGYLRQALLDGKRLSEAVEAAHILDEESRKLLEIGEESGTTCERLEGIGREVNIRCRWRIQQAVKLLEPGMILILAFMVGGMLMAFLLPLIQLYKNSL